MCTFLAAHPFLVNESMLEVCCLTGRVNLTLGMDGTIPDIWSDTGCPAR